MNFALTVSKVFCDGCSRKLKTKQHQISCTTCQARCHKLCTNISNKLYQVISEQNIPHMCSRCESYTFPFLDVSIFHSYISNSDVSIINTGFSNFHFAIDTNIFQDENLKLFFTKSNPLESSYIDSDITTLMISINSI